jgi:hypothetical protein
MGGGFRGWVNKKEILITYDNYNKQVSTYIRLFSSF